MSISFAAPDSSLSFLYHQLWIKSSNGVFGFGSLEDNVDGKGSNRQEGLDIPGNGMRFRASIMTFVHPNASSGWNILRSSSKGVVDSKPSVKCVGYGGCRGWDFWLLLPDEVRTLPYLFESAGVGVFAGVSVGGDNIARDGEGPAVLSSSTIVGGSSDAVVIIRCGDG
jgi:hypothetical protein